MDSSSPVRPARFFATVWQRKWWVILPALVAAASTFAVTSRFQVRYQSQSTILVVPQRIPEAYIRSTVTTRIEDRLQTIKQQIMSRTKLEGLVTELDLYAEERKTAIMEDIIERLRREIQVEILRGDAFRVSFVGSDPRTVQKVAQRVATMFIDESLRDRENLALGTDQFLEATIDEMRRRLEEHDKKVAAAKASGGVTTALAIEGQVLQDSYRALFAKREEAKISANVERRQIGEQFRVLDPARLPSRPIDQSPARLTLVGALVGLLVGVTLVAVKSVRRRQMPSAA